MAEFGTGEEPKDIRPPQQFVEIAHPAHFSLRLASDYVSRVPQEFLQDPFVWIQAHGENIKSGKKGRPADYKYTDEDMRRLTLPDGSTLIAKAIVQSKPQVRHTKEFDVLQRAWSAGLPAPRPIGLYSSSQRDMPSYLLMQDVKGISGRQLIRQFSRMYDQEKIAELLKDVSSKYEAVVNRYRAVISIDKTSWDIKDIIVQMEHDQVKEVMPVDWEYARPYTPERRGRIEALVV